MADPHTAARGLMVERRDAAGRPWPVMGAPFVLSPTPIAPPAPAGPLIDWPALCEQLALVPAD
jgi:hypothetical protein